VSAPLSAPAGFQRIQAGGGFMAHNGPLYLLHQGELVQLGFRVEPRHCNPMGMCHGGMLATFADMLLPLVAHRTALELAHRFLPTVSLQLDYMAPAALGDWVQGQAQVLKVTRAMAFVQGTVTSNGVMAMRCSGVFKIGPLMETVFASAAPSAVPSTPAD
jgi:uncharacterized protein (TIGR00369 family)